MSLLDDYVRTTPKIPCPICCRSKFCMVDRVNPSDPARVICTKVESKWKWGEAGWLHVLRGDHRNRRGRPLVRKIGGQPFPSNVLGSASSRFQSAASQEGIGRLAASLGVSAESLIRLRIGWASAAALEVLDTPCHEAGCWTFPMSDSQDRVVGIRLRTPGGFKYAVRGSQQGLFVPRDLAVADRLVMAEGPTDAAALLDMGFVAVGRPSCTGGTKLIVQLVKRLAPPGIAILADNDTPGVRGAQALASVLALYARDVRTVRPPDQIKDARAWKNSTPDAAHQVNLAITSSPPVARAITVRHGGR